MHIGHFRRIPPRDISIEVVCSIKHTAHICHVRRVPFVDFDITNIKPVKQKTHIGHARYVDIIKVGVCALSLEFLLDDGTKFLLCGGAKCVCVHNVARVVVESCHNDKNLKDRCFGCVSKWGRSPSLFDTAKIRNVLVKTKQNRLFIFH